MEKIQVSQEKLAALFGGAIGVAMITIFSAPQANGPIIGIMVFVAVIVGRAYTAQKAVKSGDYECFKTKCEKTSRALESCYVANNEILPGNKPLKRLDFAGADKSLKAVNVGDEIGVVRAGKEFWAFSLEDVK